MNELREAVEAAKDSLARGKVVSEQALVFAVIVPLLKALGWDSQNIEEMWPEYSAGSGRVDWALCDKGEPRLFLEVKAPDQNLSSHEEQLLQYSFAQGVPLSVLTNGTEWWFYLPLEEGAWDTRKFATLDVADQDTDRVCKLFSQFLQKEAVCSGTARKTAKDLYDKGKEEERIRRELPGIIRNLLVRPAESIVEVFQTEAQAELGVLAPAALVREALQTRQPPGPRAHDTDAQTRTTRGGNIDIPPSHSRPTCLVIGEQEIQIKYWYELLVELANWLARQGRELPVGVNMSSKPLITRSADDLHLPKELKAGAFIETHGTVSQKYKRAWWLLEQVGLPRDTFMVRWEER